MILSRHIVLLSYQANEAFCYIIKDFYKMKKETYLLLGIDSFTVVIDILENRYCTEASWLGETHSSYYQRIAALPHVTKMQEMHQCELTVS